MKTDSCWLWTGCLKRYGYLRDESGHGGKRVFTHRLSWGLHYGPIPDGMKVLHRCDNPACVRPDHLFLGTQADNVRDCVMKGRARGGNQRGELSHTSKLTDHDVAAIRAARLSGALLKELAPQYGVSESQISRIARGVNW